MFLRLAHHGEHRQHVGDVGDHVHLHGRLALPVLRPLYAPVRKLDRGGVYRVYPTHPELGENTLVPRPCERGVPPREGLVDKPEEAPANRGRTRTVRMGERAELHGLNAAYAPQLPGEYRREVDKFVQREHMGKLAEHQKIDLRRVGELPRLDHFVFGQSSSILCPPVASINNVTEIDAPFR